MGQNTGNGIFIHSELTKVLCNAALTSLHTTDGGGLSRGSVLQTKHMGWVVNTCGLLVFWHMGHQVITWIPAVGGQLATWGKLGAISIGHFWICTLPFLVGNKF